MFNYYKSSVRELCHAVKERDNDAIKEMAMYFIDNESINKNTVIVPVPNHEGFAVYTKQISEIVSSAVGCTVMDVLRSDPREQLYKLKKSGNNIPPHFYLTKSIDLAVNIVLLDNVISTGMTYRSALQALKMNVPIIAYAYV